MLSNQLLNSTKNLRNLLPPQNRSLALLTYTFLVASIIYFFSKIFFGIDFTDSFYHLNQALDPADGIFLYPFFLSSVILGLIVETLGPEIIYLRFINSFLLFLSLLIPFFLIRVNKTKVEVAFYIGCILILFAPFNVNILGYDTLSILILSLVFSYTILYIKKPHFLILTLISFLCSAAVLIRLPNLLLIFVVLLTLCFMERIRIGRFNFKFFRFPLFFLFTTFILICFGYSLYYPGVEEFLEASVNSTYHHLWGLLYNYFIHGIELFLYILLIIGGYCLFKKFYFFSRNSPFMLYGILGFSLIIFISSFIILSKYSQKYFLLLTAVAISILIIQIVQNRKNEFDFKNIVSCLFLLFLFINPFGSSTGLLKATSLFLLLPFVLSVYELKFKKYWGLILIIVLPFSFIENFYRAYEDKGLFSLNKTIEHELLHHIKTTDSRADFLKNMDLVIKELQSKNIQTYFYGDKSHIFHYLYPQTSLNINSFYQPIDDLVFYPQIERVLGDKQRVAFFIVDSYQDNIEREQYFLEKALIESGYSRRRMGSILFYQKITTSVGTKDEMNNNGRYIGTKFKSISKDRLKKL